MTTPNWGSELLGLRERVRRMASRRADLAWKALTDQVDARSEAVVETLLSACRDSTLERVVTGTPSHRQDEEGCVGDLAEQRVCARIRGLLRKRQVSAPVETAATASERFGRSALRRHRAELQRVFRAMKLELWTSVVRGALLEAGALVVRVEAGCSETEVAALTGPLARELEATAGPLGEPGAALPDVAEHVAASHLVSSLNRSVGRRRRAESRLEATVEILRSWEAPFPDRSIGLAAANDDPAEERAVAFERAAVE